MQIYIISKLKNAEKNLEVAKQLEETGIIVHLPQRDTPQAKAIEMFNTNIKAMNNSEAGLVIGESYGTGSSFEIGYFYKSDKPLYSLGEIPADDRMIKMAIMKECKTVETLLEILKR